MILTFRRPHLSLNDLPQTTLPNFTVLTGINGAGKTHLLKALQNGAVTTDITNDVNKEIRFFDSVSIAPKDDGDFEVGSIYQDASDISSTLKTLLRSHWGYPAITTEATKLGLRGPSVLSLNILCNATPLELERIFEINSDQAVEARERLDDVISMTSENVEANFQPDHLAILKSTSQDLAKRFISVTYDDIVRSSKPIWGAAELFQNSFAKLFTSYRDIYQSNSLHRLEHQDGKTDALPLSKEEFEAKFGSPPWDFVNTALTAAGLTFTIDAPSLHSREPYKPRLKKRGSEAEITFDGLSSGERVIMSFAFAVYYASDTRQTISRPKILLLDEVDASLHPSMCRNLLATIKEVLVEKYSLSVIITTHSPSTVALAPEEAVYVMRPGEPGIHKVSRDAALRDLTAGVPTLSLKNDGRRQVFVESPIDVSIYEAAYTSIKDIIASELSPIFIATGGASPSGAHTNTGCDTVRRIVASLREAGAVHTIGLLDWDGNNVSSDGIFVLAEGERNGLESVFLDPLLLLNAVGRHIDLNAISYPWPQGATYLTIRGMPSHELQGAIDAVQLHVLGRPRQTSAWVYYNGGFKLEVDQEYLIMDDHKLEALVMNAYPELKAISRGRGGMLMEWMARKILSETPNHIPMCLIDTLKLLVAA